MIYVLLQISGCVIAYFAPLQSESHPAYAPILDSFAGTGYGWISQDDRASQANEQTYGTSPKPEIGGRISSVGNTARAQRAQRPAWRYQPKKSFKYHRKKSFKYQRRSSKKHNPKKSFKYHPKKKGWKYNPRRTWKHRKSASGSRLREL